MIELRKRTTSVMLDRSIVHQRMTPLMLRRRGRVYVLDKSKSPIFEHLNAQVRTIKIDML